MPETVSIDLVKDRTVMQGEGAAVQAADKAVGRRARIGFEGHREGQPSFCDVCPYRGGISYNERAGIVSLSVRDLRLINAAPLVSGLSMHRCKK